MLFTYFVFLSVLFLFAAGGTWMIARMHAARGVVAHPNARSSHVLPTPSGGGGAFVVPFLVLCVWLVVAGKVALPIFMALGIGGGAVALLGYLDDLRDLSSRLRLICQGCIIFWVLWWVGDMWVYSLLPVPALGVVLTTVAVLWWLNLFNFMDGIDGLAAVEAISVAAGAVLLLWLAEAEPVWIVLWAGLAFCVAGFLCFNWAPAKIFMGDVGSCFLGLVIAILALFTLKAQLVSIWGWVILTASFWSDATLTLLRRMLRGERWDQAHRSHAYQILSRRWNSHRSVSLLAVLINVVWLIPLAVLESYWHDYGAWLALLACLPLLIAQRVIGSGDASR